MADVITFLSIPPREQALVALAVLLDGFDAADYLQCESERRGVLNRAASELARVPLELRLPLAGTLLRRALDSLENDNS